MRSSGVLEKPALHGRRTPQDKQEQQNVTARTDGLMDEKMGNSPITTTAMDGWIMVPLARCRPLVARLQVG